MAIDRKELEIIAVAVSYSAGCIACTKHHISESIVLGATRTEIKHSLSVAAATNEECRAIVESKFGLYFPGRSEVVGISADPSWHEVFIAIGCAVARNNSRLLRFLIKAAQKKSATDIDLMQVVALANSIKIKADSYLVPVVDKLDAEEQALEVAASLCE